MREPIVPVLRRALSVPAYVVTLFLVVLTAPLWLAFGAAVDLTRHRRFVLTRAGMILTVYLFCEVWGVARAAWAWTWHARDHEAYQAANLAIVRWWGRSLFRAGVRLYRMRVEIEGEEALEKGPFILLTRHVSPVDNLVSAALVADRKRIDLRWVINRSLLRDPCMDILANRLPNAFVHGGTEGSLRDLRRVIALADGLGPNDAIAIYPEGALVTAERKDEAVELLRQGRDPELVAMAERLVHVLPPRLGGTIALLGAAPLDVVICAHVGLDDAVGYRAIANGALLDRTVRVRFWRVAAADIPRGRTERGRWLLQQWTEVDRWVGRTLGGDVTPTAARA